jgi:5-methylcytosine-specific restriction endonuclease McrA
LQTNKDSQNPQLHPVGFLRPFSAWRRLTRRLGPHSGETLQIERDPNARHQDDDAHMPSNKIRPDIGRLDRIVAEARKSREQREKTYRDHALKIYPWICGRCAREFNRTNLQMLTVHHKDHNHDNNPPDGSNWELLCLYCHDNEHSRYSEQAGRGGPTPGGEKTSPDTFRPFAGLDAMLKDKK